MFQKKKEKKKKKSYMCYSKNSVFFFKLVQLVHYCRFISTHSCLARACKMAEGLGSSFLLPVEYRTRPYTLLLDTLSE